MICVSLAERTMLALLNRMAEAAAKANLIEVRLDALSLPDSTTLQAVVDARPCPLIFTNRTRSEGGAFSGTEHERVAVLEGAVAAGADYVDLELMAERGLRDRLLRKARKRGTRVILSYHDLIRTPPLALLRQILYWQRRAGADIGKIVTTAADVRDVSRVLSLYAVAYDLHFPLVAFCMGEAGRASRVACLALGAHHTYASLTRGLETALGQIPIEDCKAICDYLRTASVGDAPVLTLRSPFLSS